MIELKTSVANAGQDSLVDDTLTNTAEPAGLCLQHVQQEDAAQLLKLQLDRFQHLKGARMLSFLMDNPREKFHCARLHIMLWPPLLDHWKPFLEQLDGSIMKQNEQQAGSSLALISGQEKQKMAHKQLDEYDLAIILCTRAWDNPATDPQTLREIRQRISFLNEYLAMDEPNHSSSSKPKHGPLPSSSDEARQELRQLWLYLSRSLTSTGKIKHLNPEIEKVYQALRQALNRFISTCSDERIKQYVAQHLSSGIYFGWK